MSTPAVVRKQDIVEQIEAHRHQLKGLGVKRLGLFGSFLRGGQTEDSDIDLLVEFEDGQKTFDNFMAVAFVLDDLFDRKVELVTRASLSPTLQSAISEDIEYVEIDA